MILSTFSSYFLSNAKLYVYIHFSHAYDTSVWDLKPCHFKVTLKMNDFWRSKINWWPDTRNKQIEQIVNYYRWNNELEFYFCNVIELNETEECKKENHFAIYKLIEFASVPFQFNGIWHLNSVRLFLTNWTSCRIWIF